MILIENLDYFGIEHALRGMRNPMNSWDKSDSAYIREENGTTNYYIGPEDMRLLTQLTAAGEPHRKFLRQIYIVFDVTAPRYWWTEFDTYKIGTVRDSCSTMHKLHERDLTLDDFSIDGEDGQRNDLTAGILQNWIDNFNTQRQLYVEHKEIDTFRRMKQLLPESYNQKATITMNYEVLLNIYKFRKDHRLREWRDFLKTMENLPMVTELYKIVDGESKTGEEIVNKHIPNSRPNRSQRRRGGKKKYAPKKKRRQYMEYVFTFPYDHPLRGRCVRLKGSYSETKQTMFDSFGDKWAFQYDIDEWKRTVNKFARKGAHIEQEIPFNEAVEIFKKAER